MKRLIFMLCVTLLLTACSSEGTSTDQAKEDSEKTAEDKGKKYADVLKKAVPMLTDDQGELSETSYDYVTEHETIFPAVTEEAITKVKADAQSVDIKLLNKNLQPHLSTLMTFTGQVVQVDETTHDFGETETWLNVYDENADMSYHVYMFKTSGDILEDDYIQFWGIPLTTYSYNTTDGGFRNTILFFASHVEKTQ
ncbi:hypothetical protein GCM10007425_06250 [Lysinibacillus alkalisoli]|uniref:Lipoprotein n=1 Tax=Lysinibacillus alkalisoli TaxID=1911548 RepID=A0A917FYZ3_9BACI|nr:hypothetical protein [Lysinibacillus alkalisoli]GGG14684.1 hypothetical protein GCM10007425_06250 [Lysinibacillus alkalisoli]